MASESLREAHDAALWKIHRVRTMNGNVYVVAVGDVMDTLNKIRAEIEQAIREETVVDSMGGEYERIVSTIDPDDVLAIIDKYRDRLKV